jgi:hypothetical protein
MSMRFVDLAPSPQYIPDHIPQAVCVLGHARRTIPHVDNITKGEHLSRSLDFFCARVVGEEGNDYGERSGPRLSECVPWI